MKIGLHDAEKDYFKHGKTYPNAGGACSMENPERLSGSPDGFIGHRDGAV